jgi:Undecaprenyl-phosphate glucose phosphotransferase
MLLATPMTARLTMFHFGAAGALILAASGRSRTDHVMNKQPNYTLTSRSGTNPLWRRWAALAGNSLTVASFIADVTVIVAMSCLTGIGYHMVVYGERGDAASFLNIGVLAAGIFVIPNLFRGEYKLGNLFAFKPQFRRAFQVWNVTFVCLLAIGFLAKITVVYSRGWMILFYASTILVLLLLRYVLVQITVSASAAGLVSARRIFLIGPGQQIAAFLNRYELWSLGIYVVGCRFLTPIPKDAPADVRRQTLDRDLQDAADSARNLEPDAIFLVLPWSATDLIDRCADQFMSLPAEIHLAPEQILHKFDDVQLSKLGPMSSLQLTRPPLSRLEIIEKRVFDLVFAAIGLVILTPLLLAVAIAITLDSPGPVFFLQRRYGFNQRQFRIIKFRTMRTLDDGENVPQATRDDPRVTRVGRWLRRWNIDEIPQLFNVLLGDMSLVGPRPHALTHDHEYERKIALYARRHNVKPGITGWAQVHGFRGETDTEKMRKRVEHDLHYIDNWSLWLDFSIVLRTALSPMAYRNAY